MVKLEEFKLSFDLSIAQIITKLREKTSIDEKSVVYSHSNEIPNKFVLDVKERRDRLPTMYWLPKLHKSNRKAMNRNWSNQKANPALKTKAGNK